MCELLDKLINGLHAIGLKDYKNLSIEVFKCLKRDSDVQSREPRVE